VPSFRRRASVLDADRVDKAPVEPERAAGVVDAEALAEEAEAEAAEAEAIAAAARAKARAIRLRRQAEEAEATKAAEADAPDEVAPETDSDASDADADAVDGLGEDVDEDEDEAAGEERPARSRRPWTLGRVVKTVASILAILATCALVALSVFMVWQHRDAGKELQLKAEYSAAGRQSVVTLMSLDFNNAERDVKRIIDNSTGEFKDDFQAQAEDFVKVAQEAKVVTEVTVNATAVESMNPDSAVVLVAASSKVTNSAGAEQEPRTWRLSVSLQREGGQIKMSKVEFVP
jgi:Mce-associated membrane protein